MARALRFLLLIGLATATAIAASVAGGSLRAQSLTASQAPLVIHGRVVTSEGLPINRARLEIGPGDQTTGSAVPSFTDRDGRFEILAPAATAWRLLVSKPGFAPLVIGAQELKPATVGDGGRMSVAIPLVKGAALTGTVIDDTGDPVVGALVTIRYERAAGGASLDRTLTTDTDDRGMFRIGSLPAGEIEASVSLPLIASGLEARARLSSTPIKATMRGGEEVTVSFSGSLVSSAIVPQAAQGAARPARGTAAIQGRVLGPGDRPVRNAVVRALPAEGGRQPATSTDENGRYEISALPAGRFRVQVNKTGLPAVEYGQVRALQQGRVLSLRAGDRLQGIDVTLSRGGVIAGRIVDALGEPLEGVSIQVWRSRFFGGRFVAMPSEVRDRRTDDRGEYRLYDLPPATYYLVAGAERPILPAAGASASKGLPVYYPGRVNIVDAQSVRIDAGASVNGMDIVFDPPPGARVRGRALDSSGSALRDGLVVLTGSARSAAPLAQPHVAEVGQDGSFEIVDVPPGEFLLRLQGRFNDHPESVSTLVTVDRPEVPPLTVRTLVGSHISGRVVLEGNGAEGAPTGFAIGLLSSEFRSPLFDLDEFDARVDVKADGTFSFDHVSGEYRFVAVRAPEGWWLKSVTVDGINAADESVTFGTPSASRQDVEVVFSRTAAVITGRAIERREAVNDYSVVVFPTDPARRYDRSRYMRLARSDQDGRFIVSGVPPGEYFVVAVDTIDGTSRSGEWQNPDLLDVLAQSARRLRVGEGQRTTVDLELVRSVN